MINERYAAQPNDAADVAPSPMRQQRPGLPVPNRAGLARAAQDADDDEDLVRARERARARARPQGRDDNPAPGAKRRLNLNDQVGCNACSAPRAQGVCSGCHQVAYCNEQCQAADFSAHCRVCK